MENQEAMAVDSDEAYVSGNLPSGSFPSIGDEKAAPSCPLSLGTEAGGEKRKTSGKRRDVAGKSFSQHASRRKGGRSGRNSRGEIPPVPGMAGSGSGKTSVSSGSLPTPTTQLSKQIHDMGLVSPLVGKRTLADRADDVSPMSDTEVVVGGAHSMSDSGYGSLPHGPSSLEQPTSLQLRERGGSRGTGGGGGVGRGGGGGEQRQRKDTAAGACVTQERQTRRDRSDSPVVPPVAESVEVVTGPSEQEIVTRRVEAAAAPFKHTISSNWERQGAKNPRLTEGPSSLQHRPIRVPTIVSPAHTTSNARSLRHKVKRTMGVSPDRPGPSRSPLSSLEESDQPHGSVVSPSHQPGGGSTGGSGGGGGGAPVNFRSIEELSRSDRQPDMEVDPHNPQMAKVISLIRSSRKNATFSGRLSPQSVRGLSPTPSPINSARSPSYSARSLSPHSPHSPHPSQQSQPNSGSFGSIATAAAAASGSGEVGPGGRRLRVQGGGGGGEEEAEAKRQSALLQVSEAHLAILPDEDGDTPLHLSIIHENVRLTQHLVKLIVGVYMNLDIANNMRQTPLHLAIITRQPHIVQLLVQAGASVNFPDRKGNTALHLASARRDIQILQMLARATSPVPDFNCKNFAGLAPVHLATRESSIDVLKFLFQMGANKNAMDACSGRTSLHYAVEAENFILVNFLLENGCNVNSATFSGNTPLHIAAGRRLKEIVALLMAYGANPAIANGEGDFPTDLPASLLMQRARMNAH